MPSTYPPPPPDPLSKPSSRAASSSQQQQQPQNPTSRTSIAMASLPSRRSIASQGSGSYGSDARSSADHYAAVPISENDAGTEYLDYTRSPNRDSHRDSHRDSSIISGGPPPPLGSPRTPRAFGGEQDPMLSSSSPRRSYYGTPPFAPPPLSSQSPIGSPNQDEYNSDPYAAYGDNNQSQTASTLNLSMYDGDSQRPVYQPGRGSMGPRTMSGLHQYAGYVGGGGVGDEDKESVGGEGVEGVKREGGNRLSRSPRGVAATGVPKRGFWANLSGRAKKFVIIFLIIILIIIGVAVAVPIALNSSKKSNNLSSSSGSSSSNGGATTTQSAEKGVPTGASGADWHTAATGGDQSTVYTEDGTSFIYNNTFGGFWNAIPFNDSARAQSDVPALNEEWDYNVNLIQGVNLGGWLLLEPFISPSLFEPYTSGTNNPNDTNEAIDEWTLCIALGSNMSAVIEDHYNTFITEKDFAEIAGAGLNWIRLPVPYWMIETWEGEPFLANVGWTYFLKALTWARKYGLRVNLDLHAVPGSQNGYNHSSKQGTINFLNGVMGIANAQRTLNYIRTLAEFISQPQYENVVPMFSVLNEPYAATIGVDVLRHFYIETYEMVRGISGIGTGKGPIINWHDGFVLQSTSVAAGGWNGFLPGADRVAIDSHPYLCFSTPNNDGLSYQAAKPCSYWGTIFNESTANFGLSTGGEWSLAINDCGQWINNIGNGQRYDGTYYIPGNTSAPEYAAVGSCDTWNNWSAYTSTTKQGLQLVAQAHMDALRHWFFWTWKTGYSTRLGQIANPLWNYQLALENGYMPTNPRAASGICTSLISENAAYGITMSPFAAPTLSAWQTGGSGAGTLLNTAQYSNYSAWPPASLGTTPTANLPTYTPTGSVITMQATTPTSYPSGYSSVTNPGDGWEQSTDTGGWYTSVAGCSYLNPWSGAGAAVPTAPCTGAAAKRTEIVLAGPTATPMPTAPPRLSKRARF